ncbi:MAG: sulfatase [Armatimonadota bacterium]|nr:MAG: sulfatase [Armatimonadota bacterium]
MKPGKLKMAVAALAVLSAAGIVLWTAAAYSRTAYATEPLSLLPYKGDVEAAYHLGGHLGNLADVASAEFMDPDDHGDPPVLLREGTPLWAAPASRVSRGAILELVVALRDVSTAAEDALLRVSAWRVTDKRPQELLVSDIRLHDEELRRKRRRALSLRIPKEAAGKILLRFALMDAGNEPDAQSGTVAIGGLKMLNPQPAAQSETKRPAARRRRPPNVLIYVIDALRPDHLGCYGYGRPTSPSIDELASAGVVFERAYSTSTWTRPAAASLLTGLWPSGHRTVTRPDVLSETAVTMAELLRARGYATGYVTTNGNTGAEFGFGQGWDHYLVMLARELPGGEVEVVRSAEATSRAVEILDEMIDTGKPWLLLAWTVDPHLPYTPLPRDRALFEAASPPGELNGNLKSARLANGGRLPVTPQDVDYMIRLYDAHVRENDRSFGELLEHLRKRELFDDTLIIVLSDHGEQLWEHRQFGHAHTLFEEELRIPLIVKFARAGGGGTTVATPVSIVDVLPTVLAAIGAPAPPICAGENLASIMAGDDERANSREIVCELIVERGKAPDAAAIIGEGRWKLEATFRPPGQPRADQAAQIRLYDLAEGERRNVAPMRPLLANYYQLRLAQILNRQLAIATRRGAAPPQEGPKLKQETRDNLRALGYVD